VLTPDDVRDLVAVLDSTGLDHFHVETSSMSVTLWRDGDGRGWSAQTVVTREPNVVTREPDAGGATADSPSAPTAEPSTGPTAHAEHLHAVTPPLLGTFYRAPQPGADPFVDVGSRVEPDSVVGIVETMKMMNPVHAGVTGRVVEICLDDAQFADAGNVLMLVEPDRQGAGG
jgi:acetyl-CoA carboxylase biotin carboxyl carrier protein